ncbi:MAG: DUF4240 domain-containing protein [Azonexus sp.]
MLKTDFWKIIDTTRKEANGDAEAHVETLTATLREFDPNDLVTFQHWFDDYYARADTWDLWGAAYIIGGGCSDDGFMDFKGWLVSRGEKVFEAAMVDPESLTKTVKQDDECQVEGFSHAARWIWCEKTGRNFSEFPPSPLAANSRGGPIGQTWLEEDIDKRFPKLAKKFST